MRLRSRSAQGWRRRRLQQVSRSDQGWQRHLPSGISAAMSARERLEARMRIERLLDEDRRRVAPAPEKATTPVGWFDHECRRCSLEGRSNNLVLRGCPRRPATNGRAKQTDLRSEKEKHSRCNSKNCPRVQSRVHLVRPERCLPPATRWAGPSLAPARPCAHGSSGGAEGGRGRQPSTRRKSPAMEGGRGGVLRSCGPASMATSGAAPTARWPSGPLWQSRLN